MNPLDWIIRFMIASMIFFPSAGFDEKPEDYGFAYEEISVTAKDGASLFGWYLKAQGEEKGAILLLHGNAGNISHRLFKAAGWIRRGFSVFLIDYRGYGKSGGSIRNKEDVFSDAEAALRWLRESKGLADSKIILCGESLGTWPALRLASLGRFGALILEAPFTSFPDLAKKHYAFIPEPMLRMLLKDFDFSNLALAGMAKTPAMVIQGTSDEICPFEMGRQVFEKLPEPKSFFAVEGGGHNDVPMVAGESYWEKTAEFIFLHVPPK
ncbi:MAG: alpha/beta hydrolase [Candidatus Omnitrophota bacterium]|jgi:hypothetical protein